MCSALLPPDVAEIAASTARPLSRKQLKRQATLLSGSSQAGKTPLLAAMSNTVAKFASQLFAAPGEARARRRPDESFDRLVLFGGQTNTNENVGPHAQGTSCR